MQIQTDMEQQQKSVFTGCEQPALMVAHGDRVACGVAVGSFNKDTVTEYQYSVGRVHGK